MIRITRVLTEADVEPIVRLAEANHITLVGQAVRKNGPICSLTKTTLGMEVRAYLEEHLDQYNGVQTETILAKDNNDIVVGFAIIIYAASGHCGMSYSAVAQSHRRQGIFRMMTDEIKSRFKSIVLTCHLHTVPVYERLGFEIAGRKDAQVQMGWGPYDVNTHMNHLKLEWHEGINKTREAYFEALRLTPTQVEKLKREITTYQTSREREVDAFLVARKTH
jgi:GNAT superfamily N-acetyltransferase